MTAPGRCPCGSGDDYDSCCARFHRGAATAPTAEALMRSRFTAFAVGDAAYLTRTWHADHRPRRLELDSSLHWNRLEIVDIVAGGPFDASGIVEFRAHHRSADGRGERHERSRFVREHGEWFYVDGTDGSAAKR